ncbi:MAG TPA: hypothetical protein VER12_00270 [Polyangiaceae bacterium]|nr:hypothetical protein [Polyangiaceae bacterium]
MAHSDVAIPVVFPDYLIMVETPAVNIDLPGRALDFKIPKSKNRVPYLGHAGILFINGRTGLTKYFEYGRYDPAAKGLVRKQGVPDAKIASDGRPSAASLKLTLAAISRLSGQGGKILGAYIELEKGGFEAMLKFANARMAKNVDPARPPYELLSNSCLHFAKETAAAGGGDMPMVIDPRPAGYIERVRDDFPDLDFTPPGTLAIEGITLK